jgi:5'(3')-deoxyribonucleotidase
MCADPSKEDRVLDDGSEMDLCITTRAPRVFIDMDGVIVDFDGYAKSLGLNGDEMTRRPGAYLEMSPLPGAIEAVRSVIGMGYDAWLATKPPTGVAFAYSDKAQWVFDHLPELRRKLILTHDKGLLKGDYLIDDRPHRANCSEFSGELIVFKEGMKWPEILVMLRRARLRTVEKA